MGLTKVIQGTFCAWSSGEKTRVRWGSADIESDQMHAGENEEIV